MNIIETNAVIEVHVTPELAIVYYKTQPFVSMIEFNKFGRNAGWSVIFHMTKDAGMGAVKQHLAEKGIVF